MVGFGGRFGDEADNFQHCQAPTCAGASPEADTESKLASQEVGLQFCSQPKPTSFGSQCHEVVNTNSRSTREPVRRNDENPANTTDPPPADVVNIHQRRSCHSQQRKSLVNLNKAVLKWSRLVANGSMTEDEIRARILASPVATHLRSVHGDQFRVDEFVQKVRRHAAGR